MTTKSDVREDVIYSVVTVLSYFGNFANAVGKIHVADGNFVGVPDKVRTQLLATFAQKFADIKGNVVYAASVIIRVHRAEK